MYDVLRPYQDELAPLARELESARRAGGSDLAKIYTLKIAIMKVNGEWLSDPESADTPEREHVAGIVSRVEDILARAAEAVRAACPVGGLVDSAQLETGDRIVIKIAYRAPMGARL